MYIDLVFAGFGGQGVLLAGDLLAFSYMRKDYDVTWFPSYGVEMRGGSANCTVIISSTKIGSPITEKPRAAVCLSSPALEKFQNRLQPKGLLVINSSMADPQKVERRDLRLLELKANEVALEKLSQIRMANMILLGALASASEELDLDIIQEAVPHYFKEKGKLVPIVKKGLHIGSQLVI